MPSPTAHAPPVTADPARSDEAIRAFRQRVPITRPEWDKLDADARDYAWTVSGVAQASVVVDVWDAIDDAVENGTDLEDFRDAVQDDLYDSWGEADSPRVEALFRTGVHQAYNDGLEEIFSDPVVKEARPYWRYELIDDDALCVICEDCQDVILPQDDEWWDEHRPPNHVGCRCSFSALSAEEAADEGVDTSDDDGVDAADGFGADDDGEYEPDLSRFPDELRGYLESVLYR